jgi:Ni/Fe-hydrogenase subunit HybB-like protein
MKMKRLKTVKSILWALVGAAFAIAVFRFWRGLGPTTALTDLTPWGFWIGFDVMGGVALAAGGFVVAATVYVFHLERYRPILRPAVLTAFLGYAAVVVGLMFDLGLPWSIWHMIVFWNPHSPLFEVGWCVMLYLTVLLLEFLPVILEMSKHPVVAAVHHTLHKFTVPLVILGIMLSSLHQSSLGSLFLIMPHRLDPLWYTPILPILFFISAVALGLMMVTTESLFSAWLYEEEYELDLLQGLGRVAAGVLWFYLAVRLGDLAYRGTLPHVLDGGYGPTLFLIEILVSVIIPATLLTIPATRKRMKTLAIAAGMTVFGMVFYRIDVGGLAMIETTGTRYIPSWTELTVSFGIVAGAALVFFWIAEHFHLMHGGPMVKGRETLPDIKTFRPRLIRGAVMFVGGAALATALLPGTALDGYPVVAQTVHRTGYGDVMILDGNRNDKGVRFDHKAHADIVEGTDKCAYCHHMVKPGAQATGCAECHTDEHLPTSIFNHRLHQDLLAQGPGCLTCHEDTTKPKDLEHSKPCLDCHDSMIPAGAAFKPQAAPSIGLAPGYMDAMHGLCLRCHTEQDGGHSTDAPTLARCSTCHSEAVKAFDPMHPDKRLPDVKKDDAKAE